MGVEHAKKYQPTLIFIFLGKDNKCPSQWESKECKKCIRLESIDFLREEFY